MPGPATTFFPKRRRVRERRGTTAARRPFAPETLESRALLTTLAWSAGPSLPEPRTDAAAIVTLDNAVRLLGGNAGAATDAPVLGSGATAWTLGFNTDTPRNDLGAVFTGSKILLYGGGVGTEGISEVLDYDLSQGDSQDLSKMNSIRYDHGYAVDNLGRAYAMGGVGVLGNGEIWDSVERYDVVNDAWSNVASLPQPLHGMSTVGDGNGHLLVFGGSNAVDDSGIQSTTYSYDVATDSWSSLANMPMGTRDSAAVLGDNGLVYVLGGVSSSGATDAVQVYDLTTNSWTSETNLPTPLYSHAAVYDRQGHIVVAGGFDASGPTAAVYTTQRLDIPDVAPVLTSSPRTTGSLDQLYTYDVNATGNPTPTYSLLTAPDGMNIDATSGLISWQPIDGQVGVHPVTVRASNRAGDVDQTFDITVVSDTIAPTTPANFAFTAATETSVSFAWDASVDAVGVDHYELATASYEGPRFGKRWVYTVINSLTETSVTVNGLPSLFTEDYAVRAVDAAGNVSTWSPRVFATTLSAPTLNFAYGTQTSGTISTPAKAPLQFQLSSSANPTATYSLVTGPSAMTVDGTSGVVQWTPDVADIGLHDVTFRASNSVGDADLIVTIDVVSDAPQLGIQYLSGG
ncbi:MAG: putative Ig domain-containing protein, partial [Planctomycetales bacterium]|nr:putative Ig domain-containing protein [Planctomycetales bacterium]